jgi:hypothetical protein
MNSVSTQTYNTINTSTQVNNINLIVEDHNVHPQQIQNRYIKSFDCKYNKIIKRYHKKINEQGHSILNWRDYDKIHGKIAYNTIQELNKENIKIPFWLILRANKNNKDNL